MTSPLDALTARRLRLDAFSRLGHRTRESWRYVAPGFEKKALAILFSESVNLEENVIWRTKINRVRKLTLPRDVGGDTVVLKESQVFRHYRYLFGPTPTAREAAHYVMLGELGFPVAEMLAAGDVRANRRLESSFIVTRFLEGFRDGRSFAAGGELANDAALKNSFILESMALLARFHQIYFYHKGFKCYNVMWREAACDRVDLCLIDFASCRFRPKITFAHHMIDDLAAFFLSLGLALRDANEYLGHYVERNPKCRLGPASLRRRIAGRMSRLDKK